MGDKMSEEKRYCPYCGSENTYNGLTFGSCFDCWGKWNNKEE